MNQAALDIFSLHKDQHNFIDCLVEQLQHAKINGAEFTLKDFIFDETLSVPNSQIFTYRKGVKELTLKAQSVERVYDTERMIEYIIIDMTAVKELEKAKAQEKSFKILVATASHDIRTPLNGIEGVLDILDLSLRDECLKEQLEIAKVSAKRMGLYLRGLSYLHQIECGSLQKDLDDFKISDAINDMFSLIRISSNSKGIKLQLVVDISVPILFCSDKKKYQLIVYFLLRNAVKYTFTGSIIVTVSFEEAARKLITTVQDTGIGIAPEEMPKLGCLFSKIDEAEHLNPQGIGLGLYLCKSLSRQLSGDISIQSKKGEGTCVTFFIEDTISAGSECDILIEERKSIHIPRLSNPCKSASNLSAISDCCKCRKVLIVDDEPMNIMVLSSYLATVNCKADKACNGEIALKKIIEKKESTCCKGYKLVLMDINMPVMDGIEATFQINEYQATKRIPPTKIVAITAAAQLENRGVNARFKEMGFCAISSFIANYVVLKPVPREEFLEIVLPFLQSSSSS